MIGAVQQRQDHNTGENGDTGEEEGSSDIVRRKKLIMLLTLTGRYRVYRAILLQESPKRGYRMRVVRRRPSSVSMPVASAAGDLA